MDKVKCECGFLNPHGTIVCESCGKPLTENDNDKKLLNMRYEGVARRSQTYTTTFIDKIWMFFSSVKVGIWIIVLLLVSSAVGTIYPQEMYIPPTVNPAVYYADEYGFTGEMYYQLGFHNLYGSWWYMLLIAGLGVSIFIASLDRFVPLYRALKNQRVTRHSNFMKRQRVYGTSKVDDIDDTFEQVKQKLTEKKYKISEENGNLVAEKGRFARWGPYVNHIGLIIFLIGCMLRYFPGMYIDEHVWIREDEIEVVPGTGSQYFVKNEEFLVELYDEDDEIFADAIQRAGAPVVKTYQTDAILYEREDTGTVGLEGDLKEIDHHEIRVNEPMKFDGFALYQVDYKLNELNTMSFTLENKETSETFGRMDIDLLDPQPEYDLGDGYRVELTQYFADYYLNEANVPSTRSKIPDNPVFIFKMFTPETPEGEVSFVGIRQNLEPLGENQYKMTFIDVDTKHVTALAVRKDNTLGFLIAGGIIFMIGLVQGSYWAHRRVWLQRINGEVWVAGHTNKNYFALRKDIDYAIEGTGISSPVDQVEEEEKAQKAEKDQNTSDVKE
ncbi:cytochrome c biogenesis protein ResB [Halalkalibacter nanhaiisediminis]|uniref:Cytochrome c biogenesis protein n=1 Tax=Halalkalibacter nanhaiisediminis TaxID=688079 RepID=A0A562QD11_9BACI|nr:cytochrome c biogenesis protein ResB [Halalkalibacter nanhaiisediminis]TWI54638.1 cytochrome c biogenesis protein [Halalkalibacter nanhaiisediminis]